MTDINKVIEREGNSRTKDRETANNYIPVTLKELKDIVSENPTHPEAVAFPCMYDKMTGSGIYNDASIVNIDVNQVIAIRDDKEFGIEEVEDEFKITRKTVVKGKRQTTEQEVGNNE